MERPPEDYLSFAAFNPVDLAIEKSPEDKELTHTGEYIPIANHNIGSKLAYEIEQRGPSEII